MIYSSILPKDVAALITQGGVEYEFNATPFINAWTRATLYWISIRVVKTEIINPTYSCEIEYDYSIGYNGHRVHFSDMNEMSRWIHKLTGTKQEITLDISGVPPLLWQF